MLPASTPVRSREAAAAILLLALLGPGRDALAQSGTCTLDTVPRPRLVEEMREALVVNGEFNVLATTNWTRFQSTLFMGLVRRAMEERPEGGIVFIPGELLFWEFLRMAGLDDPSATQAHLRWALYLGQGTALEYRPGEVVQEVKEGPEPILAINVHTFWPDHPDETEKYSYVDSLSVPKLQVTNHQEVTFRLLDFGDMVVYDQIKGVSGRPLSGLLGALFKVLGEGDVKYSRTGLAADGVQVVRAQAKKMFSKTATVTIFADGTAQKDVPEDRPDLAAMEEHLKADLEIEYRDYRCW